MKAALDKNQLEEYQGLACILHNVLFFDPNESLINGFIQHDVISSWPDFSGTKSEQEAKDRVQRYLEAWAPEQLLSLKLDYAQLFYGPGEPKAAPWGSVYLSERQLLNGESTQALMQFYQDRQVTFELDSNQPVDHLGLYFAVLDQIFAQLQQDNSEALRQNAILLLQQHLLPWSGRCLEFMYEYAQTDFYKGIAILTQNYLDEISKVLNVVPLTKQLFR
ncbi:molecular chaperone TorD [Shewanella gelidii]|uniref:Molecular chaperone TorD n=2 Tax=Shewanella gelidii TaxID=1642821 RepID=A0A917NBU3_9GAMM|nr:molecular chaperone TorD [Shewanella gelidii]